MVPAKLNHAPTPLLQGQFAELGSPGRGRLRPRFLPARGERNRGRSRPRPFHELALAVLTHGSTLALGYATPRRRPKAKGAFSALLLALSLLGLCSRTPAATITVALTTSGWPLYSLAVNVGDTVTWVNWQGLYIGTNYVQSYGGEWKSPPMVNLGDSFSFTFTNPGFYAYRTGTRGAPGTLLPGTVTVSAWTSAPPAVTLNTPVAGFVLSVLYPVLMQASVTNTAPPAEMQYFANSTLIGIATNPPYMIGWDAPTQGQYFLAARAIDRQGGAAWSQSVSVTVGPGVAVWGAKRLPTGEMLFFYNSVYTEFPVPIMIYSSDNALMNGATPVASVLWPGVFVDESLRGTTVPRRFYNIY